jgi:hypothetical protein
MNCNSGGFPATARFFEDPMTEVTDRFVPGDQTSRCCADVSGGLKRARVLTPPASESHSGVC